MTGIVEGLVILLRATIVALKALWAVGAIVNYTSMGEGHKNRCPHLDDDQSNYRDLLSNDHRDEINMKSD